MNYPHFLKEQIKRLPLTDRLVDLVEHLRHPDQQWQVWQDYRQTWQQMALIRNAALSEDAAKLLLLVSLSNSVYQVKVMAVLALGLRLQGWRVAVLTSHLHPWAHRYFRAFGLNHLVYWEDLVLSPEMRQQCDRDTTTFLGQATSLSAIKNWTYRQAKIGSQILAAISRQMKQGSPDLTQPEVQNRIHTMLPVALATVHRAEQLLAQLQPQMLLLNEANYDTNGPLVDVAIANGVNVIQAVQPSRDDALIFKRLTAASRRLHPNSLSPQTFAQIVAQPWTAAQEQALAQEFRDRYGGKWFLQSRNQPGAVAKTRTEIMQQLELDPVKKVAIVFSHVLWDANLFYGEDLFADFGDWFVQTLRAACANDQVNWLIKLHPANLWKRARENVTGELSDVILIREAIGPLPNHVKLLYPDVDISTLSLFELADYGITVRGTVGLELPCFGVLTLTAGTGRYSGLGFTLDSPTAEVYLQRLHEIQTYPPMTAAEILRAKQHAYALFKLRPWPMENFQAIFNYQSRGTHPLDHNLLMKADSLEALGPNSDLYHWATWAEAVDQIDYLHLD